MKMIPTLPLDVYVALSSLSLVFSLPGSIFSLLPSIEERRSRLEGQIGEDRETGVAYLPPRRIRKLLSFNVKNHAVAAIGGSVVLTGFAVTYFVGTILGPLSTETWYQDLTAVLSWLGLIPLSFAVYGTTRLYLYLVSLWTSGTSAKPK